VGLEDARGNRSAGSTAEAAAALRAAGTLIGERELANPDSMAAAFIAPGLRTSSLVKLPGLRRLAPRIIERMVPGGLWFEIARTRGMDQVVEEEVAAGAGQVVILGAGFDSRAYRMTDRLRSAVVFEVDHPETSRRKRERVRAVVGQEPGWVRYVTLDFNRDDLGQALERQGHDRSSRSVVVWSGVAPYLEPAGVDATLAWMAGQAPGSVIVFDYCWREMVEATESYAGAETLRRRVAAQGEPFRFGIPRGRTREFLAQRGLELVEDMDAEQGMRRFLTREDGTRVGWLWEFGGVARARVPDPKSP
jgi:methyltransferase (TIGR00027 family)